MKIRGSSARAIAILAGAGIAAFAISTAAVSSATTHLSSPSLAAKYPFSPFSFTGGVSTSVPANPATFSLSFTTSFGLAADSPGIVNATTGTLDKVTVTEKVAYPIPDTGAQLVGPAQLPFSSETLKLAVPIKGSCFTLQATTGNYVFSGDLSCVTPTLTLGSTAYSVSSLLTSLSGSFTPPNPASGAEGSGSLTATFSNPGYTFPVATLGSGGGTTLTIGANGATVATQSVTFTGSTAAGG
jgi:hypothetical protein